jgi:flagellin
MIINHNLAANNAIRNMNINSTNASKSMQKLSSGLRINSAADDAAGLAISEKMRGQIRGLDQASSNAQDAISLIQTGEGALNETTSILQRMRELAVQSASDTNIGTDRKQIQGEVDQLATEISRISNTTEFNQKNLLGGNLNDTYQVGANKGQSINLTVKAMDAQSLGVASDAFTTTLTGAVKVSSATIDKSNRGTAIVDAGSVTMSANKTAAKTTWAAADSGLTGTVLTSTANSSQYNGYTITTTGTAAATSAAIDDVAKTITINVTNGVDTAANLQAKLTAAGIGLTATGDTTAVVPKTNAVATSAGLAANEVKLTIGAESQIVADTATSVTFTSAANKGLTVNFDGSTLTAATAATLTFADTVSTRATFAADGTMTNATVQAGIDVSSQSSANSAIKTINDAIEAVSTERSKLGAYSNRLEHTIANLGTSSENLTSAESRIRDVDMAKEMSTFSKNNILSQAAQAMLAQANQQPQQVLQLLR